APNISVNPTGSAVACAWGTSVPAYTAFLHPHPARLTVVGWRSPFTGTVAVSGYVADRDPNGGDGVFWTVDKGSTTLASGDLSNGGALQPLASGTGGSSLQGIAVSTGDYLYLTINPKTGYDYDLTGVGFTITELDP
ncbi:MAG: hypothetical protein M3198_17465, partial [Actinomycetota bacterium]|nr:hypothetical protein [Actinomycetota bacterium]